MRFNIIPYGAWTNFTPTLPQFYWDVYSSEQRIKAICKELWKIHCYVDYLAEIVETTTDELRAEMDAIVKQVEEQEAKFYATILQMIQQLQVGQLQWDCQIGDYTTTVEAQRDMFNDVTIHSYNLEQLDLVFESKGMDVDGLANCGLNVKGLAVANHFLQPPDGAITNDLIYDRQDAHDHLTVADLGFTNIDMEGYLYVTPQNGGH